ncbi:hypothetical protein BGZ89_002994 [Linnemannia elongata]|nr:hypothetical protein BGZ89_002994 [Linnemannia elongata]
MLIATLAQLLVLVLATLLHALTSSASVSDSTVFLGLLAASEAATAQIDMYPEIPHCSNIFIPMTYDPNPERGSLGTRAFQRFGLHYNVGLSDTVESIKIVQGVFPPVPAHSTPIHGVDAL